MSDPRFSNLVFVYGTLKRGENNYPYWMADAQHARFVCSAETVSRYPFFVNLSRDSSSPCVLELPDATPECQHVAGEVFLITDTMLAWLDVLEDVAGGTYAAVPTAVRPLEEPREVLPPAAADGSVQALLYFRRLRFPADWAAGQGCTPLLRSFTARECIERFKEQFCLGAPAHCRSATNMGAALAALPPAHRPTTPGYESYGAPLRPPPIVLFLIDGVGDNTVPALGERTPLEVVAGVAPRGGAAATDAAAPHRSEGLSVVTRGGVSGLLDPYKAGMSCGSDTAHLSLLGYDPRVYYRGRGAYEALGAGLPLAADDVAFKSNFATYEWQEQEGEGEEEGRRRVVVRRRCDRDFTAEGPVLCAALDGLELTVDAAGQPLPHRHLVRVQYATEHRCGVAVTTPGVEGRVLSDAITGTDPLQDGRPLLTCRPVSAGDAVAAYTSRVVEAASAALTAALEAHPINAARAAEGKPPANVILLRGAAQVGWVPPLADLHGVRGYAIAPTCIIKGLAACCGLGTGTGESERAVGATGDMHSSIAHKVRLAARVLDLPEAQARAAVPLSAAQEAALPPPSRAYDFLLFHVKAVDDAGHEADAEAKAALLKQCGDALGALHTLLPPGAVLAVTADHSTPVRLGDHCCEPVPLSACVIPGLGGAAPPPPRDGLTVFSEISLAGEGEGEGGGAPALGRVRGDTLLPLLKHLRSYYHY